MISFRQTIKPEMELRSNQNSPVPSHVQNQRGTGETLNPVIDSLRADSDDDESSHPGPLPTDTLPEIDGTKTLNELEYVFSSSFDEWILKYGVLSDHDLIKHGETFVDEDGVLRYVDNWLPVDVHKTAQSPSSIRNELQETGCLRVPVVLHNVEPDDPNFAAASKHHVVNVSFLMNFRALWDYLEADNTDELIEYAPLFRMYVELFFHKRTAHILILVATYELIMHFVVDSFFPGYPVSLFILNDCQIIFQIVFYLALVWLFKGSVFGETRPELQREEKKEHVTHAHHRKRHEKRKFALHWTRSLKQVVIKSWGEVCALCESNTHKKVTASKVEKTFPFSELLNLSLKFLSKHSNNVSDKLQLNSKSHNIKLLLILCFLPLYFILIIYVPPTSPYQQYIHDCDDHGSQSQRCLNAQWTFWLSGGYATYIIRRYIYSSAVLLSLMGLNFGAEIAHSLTDSWIFRFGPLRRLSNPEQDKEDPADNEGSVADYSIKSSATGANTVSGSVQPPRASHFRPSLEQMMQNAAPLKHLSRVKFGAVSAVEVMRYVQRDSYEHYLFIREFMTIASRSWSGPIVTFAFFAVFLMSTFSFLLVMYIRDVTPVEWVYYALWMFVRLGILVIHPVMSLAHANAYVYALQEQFLVAAPEDFAVLGGRDAWMDYLVKVPAIWTVYGMWVTWERLTGLLWTLVAGMGAVAISVVSADF